MSYNYGIERARIFSDEGQRHFLAVRDAVKLLLDTAGAIRCDKILTCVPPKETFLTFTCLDRMVELEELCEVSYGTTRGQDRIFTYGAKKI